ncbi:MAG: FtsH protease activity modulator HflK [Maritimibacter sp.]
MASDSGGPWGGGGNRGGSGGDNGNGNGGGRRPGEGPDGPQIPEIEELMKKGQERLQVLMGGGNGNARRGGGSGGGAGPKIGRGGVMLLALAAVVVWGMASFYRVDTSEQSVELMFGKRYKVGVVWNIGNIEEFVFNLADPVDTITAVSESAMREIIGRSELSPVLNRDRGAIAQELQDLIQETLDTYESGVHIVRVNFDRADPPSEVIDSFREVQAAEQTRDTLQKQADAYANQVIAGARGQAAQTLEQAEAYRAQVVNEAEGEAARFIAVYDEYVKAEDVTRKRLYLETMQRVLSGVNKVIIDPSAESGQGVVPYLPLSELRSTTPSSSSANTTGGSN